MEIETVMSYIADSVNPTACAPRRSTSRSAEDVQEELGHAQALRRTDQGALRRRPGLEDFAAEQSFLQPPASRPTSST
jgi:hypothetical protein